MSDDSNATQVATSTETSSTPTEPSATTSAISDENCLIGIIGGSGMYSLEGLENVHSVTVDHTPFGKPSAAFTVGSLYGVNIAFLARHGAGHVLLPSELPFRANIYAFKQLGVKYLISVSACGSLREQLKPGDVAVPNGLFDRTSGRDQTFFGNGAVAHISLAEPFCPVLSQIIYDAAVKAVDEENAATSDQSTKDKNDQTSSSSSSSSSVSPSQRNVHLGGDLVSINGPRFSTKTESNIFRKWGLDLINMTTVPEAQLAREAEIR